MKMLCRWVRRALTRRTSGQSTVELAAVFSILVPVMVGAADLSRAYFGHDLLVHAVNEGARRGSFDSNSAVIVATVQSAGGALNLQAGDVTVTCYAGSTTTTKTCSALSIGDSVRVGATAVFTPFTPLVTAILPGGTLTLSATAQRTFQ